MITHAGIYSDRGGLAEGLRAACPGWTFSDEDPEREACRVAIVDEGMERPGGKSVVRVILSSRADGPESETDAEDAGDRGPHRTT